MPTISLRDHLSNVCRRHDASMPLLANIVAPTVNLNGTSRSVLIAQQIGVMEACDALLTALGAAAPHGRDYQTAKSPDFDRATLETVRRIQAVSTIRAEAAALGGAISDQAGR